MRKIFIYKLISSSSSSSPVAKQSAKDNKNAAAFICLCLMECILGIIERLVEYFNQYAYVQVAMYGKPFMQAAKDTWDLVKRRGLDALINDSLIDGVLIMGGIIFLFV
jgi:hypothetical protein